MGGGSEVLVVGTITMNTYQVITNGDGTIAPILSSDAHRGGGVAVVTYQTATREGNVPIVLESNQNHATAKETEACPSLPASMGLGGGYVPMIVEEVNAEGNRNIEPGAHPGSYNGQDAWNDMLIPGVCGMEPTSRQHSQNLIAGGAENAR